MSKPELLALIGLPASGKTSTAKEWMAEDPDARIRVNYDELRIGMFGPHPHTSDCTNRVETIWQRGKCLCGATQEWIWNRKEEEQMKANARRIVVDALRAGLSVVIDNTNLSKHVRASWAQMAKEMGAEYIEQDVSTPLDECIRRDRVRDKGARVGAAVIDRMAMEYGLLDWGACDCGQRWLREEHFQQSCEAKKPIAIVDIDGTVADCSTRLHHIKPLADGLWHKMDCPQLGKTTDYSVKEDGSCPVCLQKPRKNWDAFFAEVANDKPIINMINLVTELEQDHIIVMVSGRPISSGSTKVGILTEDWLRKWLIDFSRLFLRQTGDHQQDFEYKKAVLDFIPKDRIKYVFEDRDQCVRMYRDELKRAGSDAIVMQVSDGAY